MTAGLLECTWLGGCEDLPLIIRHDERLLMVLLGQNPIVRIWHFRYGTLVHGFPHRVQVGGFVPMVVLATPHTGVLIRVRLAEACNVDVQSISNIDPPGINNVVTISPFPFYTGRIDIQHKGSLQIWVVARSVVVHCLVVVLAHVSESGAGYLGINVPVPR